MRLLFMMAQAYFPRQAGGVQTVTKALAGMLAGAGHEVAVAAEMSLRGGSGARAALGLLRSGGKFSLESFEGIPVYRARRITDRAASILHSFKPDCVVVQSMDAMRLAHAVNAREVPLVVCWHDVETQRLNGSPAGLVARFVANSEFTAGLYERACSIRSVVIPPVIQRDLYEVASPSDPALRRQVTFVNPVPDKGMDLAIEIAAACPDIPFEFVESWILEPDKKAALLGRIAPLPNVAFTPHQTTMRPVYARTRILLAPSQWREAWGRVASEAHVSGIPVIASRIGGLVESVGPGGILVPPDAPAQVWTEALRSVWDDQSRYAALSAAARAYSLRPELQQSWAVERMLAEIDAAISLRAGRHSPLT